MGATQQSRRRHLHSARNTGKLGTIGRISWVKIAGTTDRWRAFLRLLVPEADRYRRLGRNAPFKRANLFTVATDMVGSGALRLGGADDDVFSMQDVARSARQLE